MPRSLYQGWADQDYEGPLQTLLEVAFTCVQPIIVLVIKRGLGTTPETCKLAEDRCEKVFDEVERRLSQTGGMYLGGDSPCLADFAFAALSKTIINPDQFGKGPVAIMPQWRLTNTSVPPQLAEIQSRFRNRPAGQLALRMYKIHRREVVKNKNT
jgi:glutathione S-transferase